MFHLITFVDFWFFFVVSSVVHSSWNTVSGFFAKKIILTQNVRNGPIEVCKWKGHTQGNYFQEIKRLTYFPMVYLMFMF